MERGTAGLVPSLAEGRRNDERTARAEQGVHAFHKDKVIGYVFDGFKGDNRIVNRYLQVAITEAATFAFVILMNLVTVEPRCAFSLQKNFVNGRMCSRLVFDKNAKK